MSKTAPSPQLLKESALMMEVTTPFITKMLKKQTLSVEKVEILNLQMAAKHGCHAMMEILLTTGEANVNAFDSARGNTALHFAVYYKQLEMVKLLVKFGAKMIKNKKEITPLHLANDRAPDIYKYLLISPEQSEGKEIEVTGQDSLDSEE
jgi:ankyrin repeat protein